MAIASADPIAAAQSVTQVLRLHADSGEKQRAITPEAHAALVESGVFDLARPKSFGGAETDLVTIIRAIRELARADGSAGWCAMISGVYSSFAAYLPAEGAREVFANNPAIIAGALSPMGQAVRVEGGYRLNGRWTFGSNSHYADWMCGGFVTIENGAPVMATPQMPRITLALFPRSDVSIIDTWNTTGLAGTGSNDYAVSDLFVPESRTFWFSDEPREPGVLYQLPPVASYGLAISAVTVGIAFHMLDLFQSLAPTKYPVLSPISLQEKANVHDRVGIALATVQAANAYLEQTAIESYAIVAAGGRLTWEQRGKMWLAGTHAAQMAYSAINDLYTIAGASSVFATNELDRCLRDARTACQHIMTQVLNYEIAGKQFLGLDVHSSMWVFDYRPTDPD